MAGVILYADDHIHTPNRPERALFESLRAEMPVLGVNSLELAEKSIKSIASFKALILDWNFSNDEPIEEGVQRPASMENATLDFLMGNNFYSLIYIFSENDVEQVHGENLKAKYGKRVKFKIKDDFTLSNIDLKKSEILTDIEAWQIENKNFSVPITWSQAINRSTQSIFNELAGNDGLWIKEIYSTAKGDNVDPVNEVIDVFNNLLAESLIQDEELRSEIDKVNEIMEIQSPEESVAKIYRRIYYTHLTKNAPVMTGDIFKFSESEFGILITPECDINKKLHANLEFLVFTKDSFDIYLKKHKSFKKADFDNTKPERKEKLFQIFNQEEGKFHILPAFPFDTVDMRQAALIDFSTGFQQFKFEEFDNKKYLFKLNSPYIHQLRQRYLAYIGRVGVPAIPTSLKGFNLSTDFEFIEI